MERDGPVVSIELKRRWLLWLLPVLLLFHIINPSRAWVALIAFPPGTAPVIGASASSGQRRSEKEYFPVDAISTCHMPLATVPLRM